MMIRRWPICLVALGLSLSLGHAATGRPNVLFIAIDDLNDWVGCLGGHPQVRTPNIDRLARRGVLFSNAHCQAPICNPSRVSLLTGVLPSTSGVYELNQPHHLSTVLKDAVTLPAHYKAAGYHVLHAAQVRRQLAAGAVACIAERDRRRYVGLLQIDHQGIAQHHRRDLDPIVIIVLLEPVRVF